MTKTIIAVVAASFFHSALAQMTCLDKPSGEEQDKCYTEWAARDRAEQLERVAAKQRVLDQREAAVRDAIRADHERRAAIVAPTSAAREKLLAEYKRLIGSLYPTLNYVKFGLRERGDYYDLNAGHSLLGRGSFDVGREGPLIEKWVNLRAKALVAARIVSVGVVSTSVGGRASFSVPGAPLDTGEALASEKERDFIRECTRIAFERGLDREEGLARSLACQSGAPLL